MQYSVIQWLLFFFLYGFPGWIWGNHYSFSHIADTGQHTYDFSCRNTGSNNSGIWYGCGHAKVVIDIPDCYHEKFELVYHEEFTLKIPFTRESWNGRIKACRGIGASLSGKEISMWEQEHR